MKKPKHFATEVDLCARFIAALPKGWTSYAETAGWDILLVRDEDGFQIGIQAKLKFNVAVLTQALEEWHSYSGDTAGPDCRAVLVPADEAMALGRVAEYIGIAVILVHGKGEARWNTNAFTPPLPKRDLSGWGSEKWHEWCPAKRHALPEYVPDVAAGASAPLQLTKWKIAAIKIAITLERRGFVTRGDFKVHGIDHRRWLARESGWLVNTDGRYTSGPSLPNLKAAHPKVYEQIAADAGKWMPTMAAPAKQEALL